MTLFPVRRGLGALAILAFAAVTLSACFVTSVHPVGGTGDDADPALAGHWRGLDEDGKVEKDLFFHIIAPKPGVGLRLAMIDKSSFMFLEGATVQAGPHRYLNATLKDITGSSEQDRAMLGLHLIRYEVKGRTLNLWLLDSTEVADAIASGLLKGNVKGSGMSKSVRLTATSEELTAFFSKPDAPKYFQEKPASLVRIDN